MSDRTQWTQRASLGLEGEHSQVQAGLMNRHLAEWLPVQSRTGSCTSTPLKGLHYRLRWWGTTRLAGCVSWNSLRLAVGWQPVPVQCVSCVTRTAVVWLHRKVAPAWCSEECLRCPRIVLTA